MNLYLSKEEKQHFVRATALVALIEATIEGYAKAKSTDPGFLKNLRMGRTMIKKALTMRADGLDPEAKEEFHKQAAKLEFICVPTSEAKKAYNELIALKTTIPMELKDFEDWYCAVIETTCKTCRQADYTECPIRRVLTKYGVYPIDPAAVGKCQYSYIGTGELDKPEPETEAGQVPAEKYNLVVAEFEALDKKVREGYLPEIETLKGKVAKLESVPAAAADPVPEQAEAPEEKGSLIPVTLGLNSGNKLNLDLPEYMANNLLKELQRPYRNSRALCACHVDDKLVAVDMQEVVTIQASGMEPVTRHEEQSFSPRLAEASEESGERERYRVECKCGAEYYCSMNAGRPKARCRDCGATVFADRHVDPAIDPLGGPPATLLTNRYWVEKEPYREIEQPEEHNSDLKSVSKNFGREYTDPCNLAG